MEKISKEHLSKDECEKLYPNEYKDYIKCSSINDKIIKSFRKNKTFNTTKPEKKILDYLIELYPDTKHQFKDDIRYPFNCDFYIPSLDLFIEYHGSHFHCNKPFDSTDEKDLNKLNELIEKSQIKHQQTNKVNQYDIMIYTWTDLDVRKKKCMEDNKLNYLIYYKLPTIEQLKTDIDNKINQSNEPNNAIHI